MASDSEAGSSGKSIKMETTDPIMDVRAMNKLFPKIDNLEHFPLKVLLNIFTRLNDMDLYNLAEKSAQFEGIAKIVLNERYTHEYFVVDETKHSQDTIIDFFDRFGNEIKAIDAQNFERTCDEGWIITKLLMRAKNLEKLTLAPCWRRKEVTDKLEYVNKNLTHLILRDCNSWVNIGSFSKFHNLKKLEIRDSSLFQSDAMAAVIRNNPALESLVLGENRHSIPRLVPMFQFGQLMELVGMHLKQLKELEYTPRSKGFLPNWHEVEIIQPSDSVIDGFVNSLEHLESLSLSSIIIIEFNELLRRLNTECKNIKHLELYDIDGGDIELFDIIRLFHSIETLTLSFKYFGDEIEFLVEDLPHLRELNIEVYRADIDWSFVLELLLKCSKLQKLTVNGDFEDFQMEMEMFGISQFCDDFIESMQNPNVKMEIKHKDQIIGHISKNEVTWRKKLIRWVNYDENSSNINLLDLVEKPSSASSSEQPNPLDLILGYLDLNSLYSFSQTSTKCLQLVENHMKQHSQGTLTITNEFYRDEEEFGAYYTGLEMFAEFVTDLKIDMIHQNIDGLKDLLGGFHNLTKLHIFTEAFASPLDLLVPQVRHLIHDGYFFYDFDHLNELSVKCPNLETFELKKKIISFFIDKKEHLNFPNLKKFTLRYHEDILFELDNLKKKFKGTKTKLLLSI